MWAQLKDGFKEFATDALKEGGELVKDTADGTATAAAKVTEKAAVVTGTRNRLDLDPTRAEEVRGSAQGDVAGSSSRASKATTSVVDATRVASNPPAKPLASGVTEKEVALFIAEFEGIRESTMRIAAGERPALDAEPRPACGGRGTLQSVLQQRKVRSFTGFGADGTLSPADEGWR